MKKYIAIILIILPAVCAADTIWDSGYHEITEGQTYGEIWLSNEATVDMWGGNVSSLGASGTSRFNMYGGTMSGLMGRDYSVINISSGTLNNLSVGEQGTINIRKVIINNSLVAGGSSIVNIFGYDLRKFPTGGKYHYGRITGYWKDETFFTINLDGSETYSHINLIQSSCPAGLIEAWGWNFWGQCNVPTPNMGFMAIAAGFDHSLGLKQDGSIVAWGYNLEGQCNVPEPNTDFVAVAAGFFYSLGLKQDGSIVAWGDNWEGQCNVPEPNTGFTAIAAGGAHSLGLKQDGSIVAWGYNGVGQCDVPEPNTGFTAIAAGVVHSLGLKQDGSIVAWGGNGVGQCNVPEPNTGFTAIAAGGAHSLGLKQDGSIVAWGYNRKGECNVPSPNTGFKAVAAGASHSLGLKQDGSIVGWGDNGGGQCDVPSPNTGFKAIAAGWYHSLGLKRSCYANAGPDQTVYAWIDGIDDVNLDGSGSYDEDNVELTYKWTWTIDGNNYEANGVNPTIELPVGQYTISLIVDDGSVYSEPNEVNITVIGPVEANLCIMPKVLNCRSFQPKIMAFLRLPKDITKDQIDVNTPLLLYPGQIKADWEWISREFDFKCRDWNITILAIFDKDKLIDAIDVNGPAQLAVVGQLKTGQYFFGTDDIKIICPGNWPWKHPWWNYRWNRWHQGLCNFRH
jgi:hypothetical protein